MTGLRLFEIETPRRTTARRGRPAAATMVPPMDSDSISRAEPIGVGVRAAAGPLPHPTQPEPEPAFTVTVHGTPAPQGSKKIGRNRKTGRPIIIEDNAKTKPWRKIVEDAARAALRTAGIGRPLDGPLRVEVTFTLPKPASAPKRRRTWAATKPDVDKLQRATFDALTIAGVWREDSRLQKVSAEKVYPGEPGEHDWAGHVPGARVRVWLVPEVWPQISAHHQAIVALIDAHRDEYDQLLGQAAA